MRAARGAGGAGAAEGAVSLSYRMGGYEDFSTDLGSGLLGAPPRVEWVKKPLPPMPQNLQKIHSCTTTISTYSVVQPKANGPSPAIVRVVTRRHAHGRVSMPIA